MSKFSFTGKHILLTGAGGGLGLALARKLVEMKARLVLSDRSLENINENEFTENDRLGLHACGTAGARPDIVANKIISTANGRPGDIWLDRRSKWLALIGTIWPKLFDLRLAPLRDAALAHRTGQKPPEKRRWRLWQVETSSACNLDCIMCPWKTLQKQKFKSGDMTVNTWRALRPYLPQTQSVDFSGGGEPLLQPRLIDWIQEASLAGCKTGFLTNGLILNREKSRQLIQAGLTWIGFSVDGATPDVYEQIRRGADFQKLCTNIATVAGLRNGKRPLILINFVMMPINFNQLEDIVKLAANLGADQVNFKQCDVVRGEHGRDYGLFASKETRQIRRFKKALRRARRIAAKLKMATTAFSFVPDELPVCAQDPRNSIFIRYDGRVAPCISLANGGPTTFLGADVNMQTAHYGRLPENDLLELWETASCMFYRERFDQRVQAYDTVIGNSSFEPSLIKLNETLNAARNAMPQAPEGCRVCHYLYDI